MSTPSLFLIVYVVTIIPCWILVYASLFFFISKRWTALGLCLLVLISLLMLPYIVVGAQDSIGGGIQMIFVFVGAILSTLIVLPFIRSRSIWDLYANYYDSLLKFIPYRDLVSEISHRSRQLVASGKIIEVGCGTGNIIGSIISTSNQCYGVGLDGSDSMLNRARRKNANLSGRIQWVCCDLEQADSIPSMNPGSCVILSNVLYSIERRHALIFWIHQHLVPGGVLLVSEPLEGSSLLPIIRRHFQVLLSQGITSTVKWFRNVPKLTIVLMINSIIAARLGTKRQSGFIVTGELIQAISCIGFRLMESKRVYADQNALLVFRRI